LPEREASAEIGHCASGPRPRQSLYRNRNRIPASAFWLASDDREVESDCLKDAKIMEDSADLRPVNDDHGSATSSHTATIAVPRERVLKTVGGFPLTNFDAVAIAAAVLMVCGPLLAAVIRVG
jgi:hypothetical protein